MLQNDPPLGNTTTDITQIVMRTYTIGVYSFVSAFTIVTFGSKSFLVQIGPATYSVVASTSLVALELLPGIPSTGNALAAGATQLFTFYIADTSRDVTVSASLLYGAAGAYRNLL
jgi:hypothetical protein